MMAKSTAHISELPVQLLARILSCLDLDERLGSCALVCSTWQKAAVLTVHTIAVSRSFLTSWELETVSQWLALRASEAPISCIKVASFEMCPFRLPLQHLCGLRELMFSHLEVSGVDSSGGSIALFSHTSPLAGLTSLDCSSCSIDLQGLSSCSALQHLAFTPLPPGLALNSLFAELSALSEAIPRLQQLTSLHLSESACQDTVLQHVCGLSRLQQLRLHQGTCSAASFRSLPSSLTQLDLQLLGSGELEGAAAGATVVLSPSSTPGLCQLPALQELLVDGSRPLKAVAFDVALLTALTQLTKLAICSPLVTTAGGPTLVVLSALTQLQHLKCSLPSESDMAFSPEDYAAITASQQLTELHLSYEDPETEPALAAALFPPGRQLPHLLVLQFRMEVFPRIVTSMVDACPALQKLTMWDCGGVDIADKAEAIWANSLRKLSGLTGLRALDLQVVDVVMGQETASALAMLTGLERLKVHGVDLSLIGAAMQTLTALQGLTELDLADYAGEFHLLIFNTAPPGSPPDVWSQLPGCVWEEAVACFESWLSDAAAAGDAEGLHPLLRALRDGITHSLQQQQQLQRRVHELEQYVATQQQVAWQQQVVQQHFAAQQQQVAGQQVAQQQQAGGPGVNNDQSRESIMEQQVVALQAQVAALQGQMAAMQGQLAAVLEGRR